MRFLLRLVVFSFFANLLLAPASYALAADLNFSSNTTMNLTGVDFATFTIASGSAATSLAIGTTTFTVTVSSGSTFTVNASANITFSNTGGISTTCGSTSSVAITGPVTSLVVTPTNSTCVAARTTAVVSDTTPPLPPSDEKITSTTTSATITWVDPIASDLSSIIIFRNGGGGSPISGDPYAVLPKGMQTFTDGAVIGGETYRYLLASRDTGGNVGLAEKELVVKILTPVIIEKKEEVKEVAKEETDKKIEKVEKEEAAVKREETVTEKEVLTPIAVTNETKAILSRDTNAIAEAVGKVADPVVEQSVRQVEKFAAVLSAGNDAQEKVTVAFIAYGTQTTEKLGEGERAGSLDSYRKAYGKLPESESEWQDALRIAGGQLPEEANTEAEEKAALLFKKIYKRSVKAVSAGESVLKAQDGNDYNALRIATYGIRPEIRDLAKEQKGIGVFKGTFGHDPKTAEDWDVVRMIAYSGVPPP